MHIQESGEMYLETILVLSKKRGSVRSIDVAEHLGYSKPSVSRAVGLLKNGGFITVAGDGCLSLTEDGLAVANKIYERHTVISSLLMRIGVDKETATEDACRIEHHISDVTFNALKNYLDSKN